jgi:hypothetical protein
MTGNIRELECSVVSYFHDIESQRKVRSTPLVKAVPAFLLSCFHAVLLWQQQERWNPRSSYQEPLAMSEMAARAAVVGTEGQSSVK